ncbi:DMT family transporter [candidate division KSB1 bacterium]|nr:DMT family transporter [candidate division KSB1 bacterium]
MRLKNRIATFLLLIGTFFWGMTFVFVKEAIEIIDVFTFLSVRFTIAGVMLAMIFHKELLKINGRLMVYGIILGLVLAISYITQTIGLQYTSPSKAAFITGLSVIFVPIFVTIIQRSLPRFELVIASITCFCGIWILSNSKDMTFNVGDMWVFSCAILFAIYIILVGKFTKIFPSIPFTIIQLTTVALLTGIIAGHDSLVKVPDDYILWRAIVICAVLATAFMYTIQNKFQKFISEVKASIIFSLEPIFAAITAYFYLNEPITGHVLVGGSLIFLGMILSELKLFNRNNSYLKLNANLKEMRN